MDNDSNLLMLYTFNDGSILIDHLWFISVKKQYNKKVISSIH